MSRSHRPFWPGIGAVAIMLALCFTLGKIQGCANSPVIVAQDSEQRAYAIYGTFVIVEEQAAGLVGSPGVPNTVVVAIRQADAKAKPSADALVQAVRDYDAASHQLKTGGGSADKVSIASSNLVKWVSQAQTDVAALVAAVKQGS